MDFSTAHYRSNPCIHTFYKLGPTPAKTSFWVRGLGADIYQTKICEKLCPVRVRWQTHPQNLLKNTHCRSALTLLLFLMWMNKALLLSGHWLHTDSGIACVLICGMLKCSRVVGSFEGHSPIWGQLGFNYYAHIKCIICCYIARTMRVREYHAPGNNKNEFKNPASGTKPKKNSLLDVFLFCAS